jgi:DNA-binding LacI/PurR family transcriptional regulator
MKHKRDLRIGVVIWTMQTFGQRVLGGVLQYCCGKHFSDVKLIPAEQVRPEKPEVVAGLDGLIAVLGTNETWRFEPLGIPTVLVPYSAPQKSPILSVSLDGISTGTMAAEHLLGCGVRSVAIISRHFRGFDIMQSGFERCVAAHGGVEFVAPPSFDVSNKDSRDALAAWLRKLPLPCGIVCFTFGVFDVVYPLVACAKDCGLRIPDDIAILGLLDDAVPAMMMEPSLSAVVVDYEQIGIKAAQLLEQACYGKKVGSIRVPPTGIMVRGSTHVPYRQPDLATKALHYIQSHLNEPINANSIAIDLDVPRATLHAKFTQSRGRSVYKEICQCRLERAKQMLANTDASLKEIGYAVGLHTSSVFCRFFKERSGLTPLQYRLLRRPDNHAQGNRIP